MASLFYPAVFHPDNDSYWISFPDIPESLTEERDIEEAYAMAVYCLGLTLSTREYDHTALPKASSPESIVLKNGAFLILIEIDLLEHNYSNRVWNILIVFDLVHFTKLDIYS